MMMQEVDLGETVAGVVRASGGGLEEVAVSEAEERTKHMVFWVPRVAVGAAITGKSLGVRSVTFALSFTEHIVTFGAFVQIV